MLERETCKIEIRRGIISEITNRIQTHRNKKFIAKNTIQNEHSKHPKRASNCSADDV